MKNILKMLDDMAERLYDEAHHWKAVAEAYRKERDEINERIKLLESAIDTLNEANEALSINLRACERGKAKLSDEINSRNEVEYQKQVARTLAGDETDGIPI